MINLSLLFALLSAFVVPCSAPAPQGEREGPPPRPRTIVFLRHAEKAAEGGEDPGLSERGRRRALEVARLLGESRPRAVYASSFQRTQATVAPLAERAGLELEVVPAAAHERIVEACQALEDGGVLVVCGHSNTVPKLVRALGGEPRGLDAKGNLPDDAYTRLYLLTLPPKSVTGAPQLLELALEP